MPRPAVRSAQVVQTRRCQRLVEGAHRGVGGTTAAGEQGLSACGWQSHPAMGERRPRRQRQRGAALRRRRANSGPRATGLPQPRLLLPTAHNCGWPHARRRPPLGEPMPPHATGAAQGGRARPPALAAGRTDPVGSRREGWRCREPPWPQPPPVYSPGPVEDGDGERLPCAPRPATRGERGGENDGGVLLTGCLTRPPEVRRGLR